MQEAQQLMRDFMKFLQCSRRKNEPTSQLTTPVSTKTKEMNYESDASKSTEPGDASNIDFSDMSDLTDASTGRTGHLRTRTTKPSSARAAPVPLRLSTALPVAPPPGLEIPSGFQAPPGLENECQQPRRIPLTLRSETSLNSKAACFVPSGAAPMFPGLNSAAPTFVPSSSFAATDPSWGTGPTQVFQPEQPAKSQQIRQSIKMLKGALEEWEANLPAQATPQVPASSNGQALLGALAKLTPEEAATVRSMLDTKLATHSMAPTSNAFQPHPQRMQRPFTPFGIKAPREHQPKPQRGVKLPSVASGVREGCDESLRTQLRDLAELNNACVLMVRTINRLGLNSAEPLKEYFSGFGSVERVMVAPTRSKAQFGQKGGRVRPAPLGFVVMSNPEEVNATLARGEVHIVDGQEIHVFPFQSHDIDEQ